METLGIQLEFTALVAEVPDSSMAAKAAKKERARAFARLRREKKTEEQRQEKELVKLRIQLGMAHCSYGEYEQSISHCLRALELDPTQTFLREYLTIGYMHLEDYQLAQDLYIDALKDNPAEVWAHVGLALYYSKVESNFEMARQLLAQALALDPDNVQAHSYLGVLLMREERFDEALEHSDLAILHQPEMAHAHYTRVIAYLAKELLSEAECALKLFVQKADTIDPESAQLLKDAKEAVRWEKEAAR